MPKRWSLRKLQTTSKKTLNELRWAPRLPFGLSIKIAKKAKTVRNRFGELSCPALFLCSFDDKVSDYKTVIKTVKTAPNLQTKIVTFKGMNHFLQFDMANEAIRDLALEYFGL
jgi:pimeloyl-ACP methyl ester carboxylesterase